MKRILKDKKKLILMSVFFVVALAACAQVRDGKGNIIEGMRIGLDTKFSLDQGWFDIFVWPIAQLINIVAKYTDAGIGIIVVTLLIQLLTAAISIKQQVATQKMQMIQPEMNRINAKYKGKEDQRSKMMAAQEMQALYKKYDINPFGSLISVFIQFPIIIAIYQAVMRAQSVETGTFMGIDLAKTVINGVKEANWIYLVIFLLMMLFQFLSMKFPQWMAEKERKKSHKKTKSYADPKQGSMEKSMNMMTYFSLAMIGFLSLTWPLGMSFYWMISALARVIQSVVIQKFFIKEV